MGRLRDLTGLKIHKIQVLSRAPSRRRGQLPYWRYRCDCGKIREARGYLISQGKQRSCGCERRQNRFKDITGNKFGRLTAQWPAGRMGGNMHGVIHWLCSCDCGGILTTAGKSLRLGFTTSCGCYDPNRTHGLSKTPEYTVLRGIRLRSQKAGIPFNLTIEDIKAPATCPILGIPLFRNKGKCYASPNSPSVDRFIPSLGYVKGNVHVISHKANQLKSDASLEELKQLVAWMEKHS